MRYSKRIVFELKLLLIFNFEINSSLTLIKSKKVKGAPILAQLQFIDHQVI
jgi:hypothetical protein